MGEDFPAYVKQQTKEIGYLILILKISEERSEGHSVRDLQIDLLIYGVSFFSVFNAVGKTAGSIETEQLDTHYLSLANS